MQAKKTGSCVCVCVCACEHAIEANRNIGPGVVVLVLDQHLYVNAKVCSNRISLEISPYSKLSCTIVARRSKHAADFGTEYELRRRS